MINKGLKNFYNFYTKYLTLSKNIVFIFENEVSNFVDLIISDKNHKIKINNEA